MLLEIAVFNIESALLASESDADRIELCENAAYGGTTPSYGTLKRASEQIPIPVFPIIRPRGGDFFYTADEFAVMKHDIGMCRSLGMKGVVLGLLNTDGTIDITRTSELVSLAYPMEVTFHRAFDRTAEPFQAMEDIIQCGCKRILTSGQVPSAIDGKELIRTLVDQAVDRIVVMPGSGVRKENICELKKFTGAVEFHSSARKILASPVKYEKESMQDILHTLTVDISEINEMKKILQSV